MSDRKIFRINGEDAGYIIDGLPGRYATKEQAEASRDNLKGYSGPVVIPPGWKPGTLFSVIMPKEKGE